MNRPTDKALILARGLGTRMRKPDAEASIDSRQAAVADTGVKAMIPIGRPFLDYVLSALADAGYRSACLVIGPEHDAIRDYYGRQLKTDRIHIEFAVQPEPLGTANAVLAGEAWAGDDAFVMLNSDNYYPVAALRQLRELRAPGAALFDRDAMLAGSNIAADRIRSFAIAELNADGSLSRIIEKPDEATLAAVASRAGGSTLLSMNCWLFDPGVFDACRAIPKSPRGEFEITDAVALQLRNGVPYAVAQVKAPVLDLSSRSDIEPVRARLADIEVVL